jgi:hypothetical protein
LVEKPDDNRPRRRSRRRREKNHRRELWEIWPEVVDWMHLAHQWRAHQHNNVPTSSIKGGEFLYYVTEC